MNTSQDNDTVSTYIKIKHASNQSEILQDTMGHVRFVMMMFAQRHKQSTVISLVSGMGVVNFEIKRHGRSTLIISKDDAYYAAGGLPMWRALNNALLPLAQCLEFLDEVQSHTGVWPECYSVNGTRKG